MFFTFYRKRSFIFSLLKLDAERSRLYQEYRKAKIFKRREAAKVSKNLQMQSYKEISSRLLPPLGRERPSDNDLGDSLRIKRTRFQMDDVQRESKESSKSDKRGRRPAEEFSDDDESDDGRADLYLYRQPELNKALWETKPRPYL